MISTEVAELGKALAALEGVDVNDRHYTQASRLIDQVRRQGWDLVAAQRPAPRHG